jgi:hypothetical protein
LCAVLGRKYVADAASASGGARKRMGKERERVRIEPRSVETPTLDEAAQHISVYRLRPRFQR